MTRIELARKGIITDEVREAAIMEGLSPEELSQDISDGLSVIPKNPSRSIRAIAIGKGLRTKINANIGTSRDNVSIEKEMQKLEVLIRYGSDAVMDLSTGGPIKEIRRMLLSRSPIPVGTVPIYEAVAKACEQRGSISKMDIDDLFNTIEEHAEDGVDFITVHCALTRRTIETLKRDGRLLDIVSRGGAFLVEWMVYNDRENPLYEYFDRLLEIAKRHDITLSLGDGARPGCLVDATDRTQIDELMTLAGLREAALKEGVQVIIEGPGHVPLDQIEINVRLQKRLCKGAPFYVLGPLVTDIAMGYDHIAAAIGGAVAGAAGADFLCYVTPSEHIRLPDIEDVKEGVIASRIAAHAADIAKGVKNALDIDIEMSRRRKARDWDGQALLSLDPEKITRLRAQTPPLHSDVCSMCGEFCAIKTVEDALKRD